LSDLVYYATILVFPILTILVPEPTGARWAAQHNAFYLPPDIKARSEKNGRYLWVIKYLFLFLFVRWMALHYSLMSQSLGSRFNRVFLSLTWGILGGVFLFLFRAAYRVVVPGMRPIERQYPLLAGSAGLWLVSFVLGGLSEELWRGFCIAATYETQRDMTHAIIWISISFAVGRLGGLPGRIHGEVADVISEVITGAFLACLFIFSRSVISTIVASVIYYTSLFYYLRRSAGHSTGASA
jgi:CAAX prenyl protease-like protein